MCGDDAAHAMVWLTQLEAATRPAGTAPGSPHGV